MCPQWSWLGIRSNSLKIRVEQLNEIVTTETTQSLLSPKDGKVVGWTGKTGILWVLNSGIHAFIIFEHLTKKVENNEFRRALDYYDFGPNSKGSIVLGGNGKTSCCQNSQTEQHQRFQKLKIGPCWTSLDVEKTTEILQDIFSSESSTYSSSGTGSSGLCGKDANNCLTFIETVLLNNAERLGILEVKKVFSIRRWTPIHFPPSDIPKMKNACEKR